MAQLCSGYNQNSNMGMGLSNLPLFGSQYWVLMGDSPVYGVDEFEKQQFLHAQGDIMNSASDYHLLSSSTRNGNGGGVMGFHNLASEIERQRLEMDCILHFQNERLKAVLNEETRRREALLMHNYESKMKSMMEHKESLLATATHRTRELQNCLLMAEKEAKEWEKNAMEKEAMVTDLNHKLHQARQRTHQDAESVCNGGGREEEEGRMACKVCHVRSTCVLLLPCRHLCSCRPCESLLMFCPVCGTVKNGSLEIFFG